MYRTTDTATWRKPQFRRLPPITKAIFHYLWTNDHSHVTGLYYLPEGTIEHEYGWTSRQVKEALEILCKERRIYRDTEREIVFVVSMWERQPHHGIHLSRLANHFKSLHNTPLLALLAQQYPELESLVTNLSPTCHQPVTLLSLQDQDQEQDQDNISPAEKPAAEQNSRPAKKDQLSEVEKLVPNYQTKYPDLNVNREFEKWRDWMLAKGRNFKNYQAAFRNWLRKAEEIRAKENPPTAQGPTAEQIEKRRLEEEAEKRKVEADRALTDALWKKINALPAPELDNLRKEAFSRASKQTPGMRPPDMVVRIQMLKLYSEARPP